ncbi:MAG: hypothetical protein ABJC74_17205 [Gemmatimonadota bacterium]
MSRFESVTCLGCGCSCDDIAVTVDGTRIANVERSCTLGTKWFGDGSTAQSTRIGGRVVEPEVAWAEAGSRLRTSSASGRALVYLAAEVTTDGQRAAVALADRLGARIDSVSSDTIARGILAAQRRGRSSATLGELRDRVDLAVFWGVDPADRYPRFLERYLPRAGRQFIAVDVGEARGPADADQRLIVSAAEELGALAVMRAAAAGRLPPGLEGPMAAAAEIGKRLTAARYCAVIHDAEPGAIAPNPERAEGLIGLTQGLNTPTRAALCGLRAGGNRMGADQVLTWQTGFPMTVDFAGGAPRYQPARPASALLAAGAIDLVVVVGDYHTLPPGVAGALDPNRTIVIGPNATVTAPPEAIAIDTGRAGIHEGGTAFRLDDVPLPVTALLPGPLTIERAVRQLQQAATVAR